MRGDNAALPIALIGAGIGAGLGFVLLARKVSAHETRPLDARARQRAPKRRRRATRKIAAAMNPLGKWWGQMPLASAAAGVVWRLRGPRAVAPIAAVSAVAASLSWVLEQAMRPRTPPPGRHSPTEPAFPSGHALQASAVALTAAYVLSREGIATASGTAPLAVALPVVSGLSKLYLDRHWLTDVIGGYLLGGALAASAAAAYELGRPRRAPRALRVRAWLAR
jgi:membrane-associated phospholipid phosphatase